MKKNDFIFIIFFVLLFLPFFCSDELYLSYKEFNQLHPLISSFLKFAILATLGELIGLRIKTGQYFQKGFGVLPRAIVWGFLGITIKIAFVIFAVGTPAFLESIGFENLQQIMAQPISLEKIGLTFSISIAMNLIFAPVMMTFHKITDTHIINNHGTLTGFFTPIKLGDIIVSLDWKTLWNFTFKKTIPFFWIPAHTITFLLPTDFQVLFAALLGICLGVLLSIANVKPAK
ncbi:MAG: Mpv17/PMP22 family protein [Flavobacteriaceae bacterium]|nr:Mpv17/PMP22 family protein [Flavobacteriaceae bacterium]